MRVALLCNDRVALPALDQLMDARLLVAAGMPSRANAVQPVVKMKCAQRGVPFRVFSKNDLKEELHAWIMEYRPDVVLVKTFPYLIPEEVLSIPQYGFINFHYAPLPHWRGPNPLFWMIRNRESRGGVSVHQMTAAFDEGPVLLQHPVQCPGDASFGYYYSQLAFTGAHLTGHLLHGLLTNTLKKKEQNTDDAGWYGHPQPQDLFINWDEMEAEDIAALVRACNPWNRGAAARWRGWTFGITHAEISETGEEAVPGTVISLNETDGLRIACRNGKVLQAGVVYCEEGFYPGHYLSRFGLHKEARLS